MYPESTYVCSHTLDCTCYKGSKVGGILARESGALDSSPSSATNSLCRPRKSETLGSPFQLWYFRSICALARKPGTFTAPGGASFLPSGGPLHCPWDGCPLTPLKQPYLLLAAQEQPERLGPLMPLLSPLTPFPHPCEKHYGGAGPPRGLQSRDQGLTGTGCWLCPPTSCALWGQ